jgi:signal transduction histidine kinase
MWNFLRNLFSTVDFMPHGHCYFWRPEIIWLHVISDVLMTIAYYSIPLLIWSFVRKKPGIPFPWLFIGFASFIFGCGTTHLMEVMTVWYPIYRFAGVVKLFTAIISMVMAVSLVWILPQALALRSPRELLALNQKLEITQNEMQDHLAQLKIANEELEAFSSSVSHDLRAPLRHIHGFIELLKQNEAITSDSTSRKHMDAIVSAARKMGTLIDDLLAFSRMGRSELVKTHVDFNALVNEVKEELSAEVTERKIYWKIDNLPIVVGDPSLLRMVWVNLLSNAVKYTRPRAEARIEIGMLPEKKNQHGPDEHVFYIRDNGVGFDMKYADKLFGVFQRLHGGGEFEGTGIGLANVQRTIQRHKGRIWAESKVNEGATFYFTFPRTT